MMVGVVGKAVGCDGRGGREGCRLRWSGWSGGL